MRSEQSERNKVNLVDVMHLIIEAARSDTSADVFIGQLSWDRFDRTFKIASAAADYLEAYETTSERGAGIVAVGKRLGLGLARRPIQGVLVDKDAKLAVYLAEAMIEKRESESRKTDDFGKRLREMLRNARGKSQKDLEQVAEQLDADWFDRD